MKKIILTISIVFLVIMVLFALFACNSSTDPKISAWVCAQELVRENLKSPSTAQFPKYSASYVKDLGNNKYEISAYVDSQNSFGAVVRSYFTAKLTLTEKGFKDYSVKFY